ncbi:MAG TPA: hypothetical protein VHX38_19565 [Pseudonocardiaceae bacterium]|jgi:hypothetical protein|nr:hypothetical protein [Pseudonocardiaceae bacterium]
MGLPLSVSVLILLCVLAAFAVLLRWSFGNDLPAPNHQIPRQPARRRKSRPGDYGLLREIAIVPSTQAAQFVRDQLRGKGIRSTIAPTEDGAGHRILVFLSDVNAATATLLREGDPE